MEDQIIRNMLMYFILPLWLAAGFADWLCHRHSNIATTSGPKESAIHLLLFAEMAVPVLAAMFLQINALVILVMIIAFALHEATSIWDVSYASATREVTPIEQHVHSFLEMLPLLGVLMVIVLHWSQFLALFGLSNETARFEIALKEEPLPVVYVTVALTAVVIFEILPYLEELYRGLRQRAGAAGRKDTTR
jgi:Trk-type K+ transport system membrane component